MPIGAIRYGVMCGDDGVVFDDGFIARLGAEHYLITTTSSGAAAVGELIEGFVQGHPDWHVQVTPMVANFASINVAGLVRANCSPGWLNLRALNLRLGQDLRAILRRR